MPTLTVKKKKKGKGITQKDKEAPLQSNAGQSSMDLAFIVGNWKWPFLFPGMAIKPRSRLAQLLSREGTAARQLASPILPERTLSSNNPQSYSCQSKEHFGVTHLPKEQEPSMVT